MLILWNYNNDSFIYTALLKQVYLGKLKKLLHTAPLAEENNFNSYVFSWSLSDCSYKTIGKAISNGLDDLCGHKKWPTSPNVVSVLVCREIKKQRQQRQLTYLSNHSLYLVKAVWRRSLDRNVIIKNDSLLQVWQWVEVSALFISSNASRFAGVQKFCFEPKKIVFKVLHRYENKNTQCNYKTNKFLLHITQWMSYFMKNNKSLGQGKAL